MEEFNIEDFKDYQNISDAQYTVTLRKLEDKITKCLWQGKFKEAHKYSKLYKELGKLLKKRKVHIEKYGLDNLGKSR